MVFIKKIILKGFKSYQEQLNFDDFDKQYNIIVGKNGSGKSNFYDAIRFVLCDEKFGNLRVNDRQFLLHEGNGESVVSAFVEIIFDNTDRRFMVDKDEVSIKRCIGLQKDEYFLNDKRSKKEEIMNLLESAGFSRSNPYYIVQQNRVNSLAMMRDSERLDLLREIAGTNVYDEKREESRLMLRENENKIQQIDEVMGFISSRMEELVSEQEELRKFEELDKKRKGIEHAIFTKKINEIEMDLEKNEEERMECQNYMEEDYQNQLRIIKQERRNLKEEIHLFEQQRNLVMKQLQENDRLKIEHEMKLQGNEEKMILTTQLEQLRQRQKEIKEEIEIIRQQELEINNDLLEKRRKEAEAQAIVDSFYQTIGRKAKYSSDEEYKEALTKEIEEIERFVQSKEIELEKLKKEVKELREQDEQNRITASQQIPTIFTTRNAMNAKQKEKEELVNKKRSIDNQLMNLEIKKQTYGKGLSKLYKRAENTRIKKQLVISEFLRNYVEEKRMNTIKKTRYYGLVIENFTCNDEFYTAIEAVAGNALFYCIVDTDTTASELIKVLEENKLGRMSFIPLNQIKEKRQISEETSTVHHLIGKLRFSEEVEKAIQFVFGNIMICNLAEEALAYQSTLTEKVKCVTNDGDVLNGKGIITGGYRGERTIDLIREIEEMKEKIEGIEKEYTNKIQEKQQNEEKQKRIMKEMEELQTTYAEEEVQYEKERIERINEIKRNERIRELLKNKEKSIAECDQIVTRNKQNMLMLENERDDPSPINREKIEQAKNELLSIQKEVNEKEKERMELDNKRQILRNEYQFKIINSINELERKSTEIRDGGEQIDIEKWKLLIKQNEKEINDLNTQIEGKIQEEREKLEYQREIEKKIEKQNAEQSEREKHLTKLFERRTILESKKAENVKRIEELGKNVEIIETQESMKELEKELEETMKELKKYKHVNKKAKDQYKGFIEQETNLKARKEEIMETQQTIIKLIESLDDKKEEAIERTFKGVSKSFTEIFHKLVPQGSAKLVMIKKPYEPEETFVTETQGTQTDMSQTQHENDFLIPLHPQKKKHEVYSGISLKVIFPAFGSEAKTIQQLSGGQKTVVALSLIFAIQRCDPAPFYLFDEIDSNLDTVYREAVASLISEQSKEAQYIITTFRQELLLPAKKWYEIRHQNKISTISPIQKEEALRVIKEENEKETPQQSPFHTPLQTPRRRDSDESLTPNI